MGPLHCPMDEPRREAVARVVLGDGEDEPALDVQLADDVAKANERGLTVTAAYGTVAGPLNDARRGTTAPRSSHRGRTLRPRPRRGSRRHNAPPTTLRRALRRLVLQGYLDARLCP